jgi:ribonuclease P protein component
MNRLFKGQHIRKSSDFAEFRSPRAAVARRGTFVLKSVVRNSTDGCEISRARIGIIVPRKVGNAVKRNRVRRIFREVFRTNGDVFSSERDYLFIALPGICLKSGRSLADAAIEEAGKFSMNAMKKA